MGLTGCGEGSTSSVMLLYNSAQTRRAMVMPCRKCIEYDITSNVNDIHAADVLVLDGHSNPPSMVLGLPLEDFMSLVAAVNPQTLVGVTCRLGELKTLERLFEAAPHLERIIASPAPLPWEGFEGVAECIAMAGEGWAACVNSDVYEYTRSDVSYIGTVARHTLSRIRACDAPARVVRRRRHPPYLCLTAPSTPPLIWRVEYGDLEQDCENRQPHSIEFVACVPGDDLAP